MRIDFASMRKSAKVLEARRRAKREGWLRWIRQGPGEEADERAMLAGCRFDRARAEHWFTFVDKYATLTEGAWRGKPFTLLDWQRTCSGRFFGWVRESPEWGHDVRRFRYWYEEVPKKNGKTPFIATVGNYLLFADSAERQINLYLAATTRKQAERCLVHAIRQVKQCPALARVARPKKLEGFWRIEYGDNVWDVLAADPASCDGVNGHCLTDELHRWQGFQFWNALRWMLASQPEGVFCAITTAGDDAQGPAKSAHDKTVEINAGRQHDDTWYGEIYAADKEDDPHDEKTWFKANPSLGTDRAAPIKLSTFRQDYEAAKRDPTQWPTWLQLRLNLWRTGAESWVDELGGIAAWDAGEAARKATRRKRIDCFEPFTREQLAGLDCYVALDGATHHDTTALVFLFVDEEDEELYRVLPFYWLPEAEALLQQSRVPYRTWSEDGHITLTPGDAIDFNVIYRDALKLFEEFSPRKLFFDPMFQAEWLTQRLADETSTERVEFAQTIIEFTRPTKTVERAILSRKIRHNGHPVLTWQLGNTQVRTDVNNNKRPVKRKKDDYRTVDGVVAMIMSTREVGIREPGEYYEDHEVEWV